MVAGKPLASPLGTRHVERFLRRLFALAGVPPAQFVRGDVAPSIEVRPVFSWDYRDFGILKWTARCFSPAVAARLSYVELSPPGATPPTFDITIDRVANLTGSVLDIHNNNVTQAGANITALTFGLRDSGMAGPWQLAAANIMGGFNRGDIAAIAGYHAATLAASQTTDTDLVLRAGGNTSGGVWVTLSNPTVNTAAFFQIWGSAIPTQADIS